MPIIERPDFFGDAVARLLTNESEAAARKHNEEKAARKKRQKTTAIVGSAIVGGAAGLAAAPAGVASTAGTFQLGTTLGGVTATGVPALAGQIGGTLAGVGIGAQVGGQLANEDYAGAIGTLADAGLDHLQNKKNERFFGGPTTPEGRAQYSELAKKAGTTIDALMGSGLPAGEALDAAREAEAGRVYEANLGRQFAIQDAKAAGNSERIAIDDAIKAVPGREPSVDHKAITAVDEELVSVDEDAALHKRSGGSAGAPLEETLARKDFLGRVNRAAMNGPTQRKQPPYTIHRADGTTRDIPWGSPYTEGGKQFSPKFDARTGKFTGYSTADQDELPLRKQVPPELNPEQAKEWINQKTEEIFRAHRVPEDRYDEFFLGADNIPVQMRPDKGDANEPDIDRLLFDIRDQLTTQNAAGEDVIPSKSQMRHVLNQQLELRAEARRQIQEKLETEKEIAADKPFFESIKKIWDTARTSRNVEDYIKILNDVRGKYGPNKADVPPDLYQALSELDVIFQGESAPLRVPAEFEEPSVPPSGGAG